MRLEPKLLTPGVIAAELGAPIHRVTHVLATRRHIRPTARAGTLRLYDRAAIIAVRDELHAIDARRTKTEAAEEAVQ
jgi:hypothetical protein